MNNQLITGIGVLRKLPILLQNKQYDGFLLLTDRQVYPLYGKTIIGLLAKIAPVRISIAANGEKAKDLRILPHLLRPFFSGKLTRKFCLVSLGGGSVSDIGGFLAAVLLRGIDHIVIPTTLLSMVDAAIGGKNGLNFKHHGVILKNMIGTFRHPNLVISDVETLKTLPESEILNGLGEMIKYYIGWKKPSPQEMLNIKLRNITDKTAEIIADCQKIKMDIIKKDRLEKNGLRQKLNLGHTVGHALEAAASGRLSHGQAVAVGIVAAAKISRLKGLLSENCYNHIISTIKNLSLPVAVNNLDIKKVIMSMQYDKKDGNFVLVKDIGQLITAKKVEPEIIRKILTEIII